MDTFGNRFDSRKDLIEKMVPPVLSSSFRNNECMNIQYETFTTERTIEMKRLLFHLEKTLMTEMQHQIDAIFLNKYVQENLIPRGLRIGITPTFQNDAVFIENWSTALDNCSRDLLKLLISKREALSEMATMEIDTISEKLIVFHKHPDYSNIRGKIQNGIKNSEFEFMNRKKNKLLRDRNDKATGHYRLWDRKDRMSKHESVHNMQSRTNGVPSYPRKNHIKPPVNSQKATEQSLPAFVKSRTFANSACPLSNKRNTDMAGKQRVTTIQNYTSEPCPPLTTSISLNKIGSLQTTTGEGSAIEQTEMPPISSPPKSSSPCQMQASNSNSQITPHQKIRSYDNPSRYVSPMGSPETIKKKLEEIRIKCNALSSPLVYISPPNSPNTLKKRLETIRKELKNILLYPHLSIISVSI